jgi:glycosyl transferase family 25
MSDLVEKLEWVKNNDSKARVIAENAMAFVRDFFSSDFQKKHIKDSLTRIVKAYESPCPHIFYINLEKRADRRTEIENEVRKFNLFGKTERFNAVHTPQQGNLGCAMSHLAVLKLARERKYPKVLILEDDFYFVVNKEVFEHELTQFFESNIPYDVLMVSYHIQRSEPTAYPFVQKVIEAQTGSGYIVHENFYNTLIAVYEEAVPLLQQTNKHWEYANDQSWKRLQPVSNWFALTTRCGKQRDGFSDNSNCFRSYGV